MATPGSNGLGKLAKCLNSEGFQKACQPATCKMELRAPASTGLSEVYRLTTTTWIQLGVNMFPLFENDSPELDALQKQGKVSLALLKDG